MTAMLGRRSFFHQASALALFLCVAGIASAKDTRMLIDKISVDFYSPQVAISADQYRDQQDAIIRGMNEQLKGGYRIVAQHFYKLPVADGKGASYAALDMSIDDYMASNLKAKQEYKSPLFSKPILTTWKVGVLHPEHVAIAVSDRQPNGDVLLGYFELEKQ